MRRGLAATTAARCRSRPPGNAPRRRPSPRAIGSGPTAEPPPKAIYTTPAPSATPYIRTGSDYFLGQRIQIDTITIRVTGYQTQPAPSAGQAYHLVTIEPENPNPVAVPLLFDLSQLRTIKGSDGRTIQGEWYHDARAARAAGISPATDPALDEDASGQIAGGYPPGTTRRTLVFVSPAGDAQTWGMAFSDADTPRDGGVGSNQVWVLLRADPNCTAGPGGGAGSGGQVPPGVERDRLRPLAGPARHPDHPWIRLPRLLYGHQRTMRRRYPVVARRHRFRQTSRHAAVCHP